MTHLARFECFDEEKKCSLFYSEYYKFVKFVSIFLQNTNFHSQFFSENGANGHTESPEMNGDATESAKKKKKKKKNKEAADEWVKMKEWIMFECFLK